MVKDEEALKSCKIHANPSGWMSTDLLKSYIDEVVIPIVRTTSIYQPLDICVNKRLKSFLRRNSEIYKLKQLHTDSNSIIIKAPDRASLIKDIVKLCKEDRTVVNRWRRIGLFDESIQPIRRKIIKSRISVVIKRSKRKENKN